MGKTLAVLLALGLAGCGGALSREEYDKRGNNVLAHAIARVEVDKAAIRERPRDPAAYRTLAKDLRAFADQLEAVGDPPQELTARINRILDHMRGAASLFDGAADALARNDIATFRKKVALALQTINRSAGSGMFG